MKPVYSSSHFNKLPTHKQFYFIYIMSCYSPSLGLFHIILSVNTSLYFSKKKLLQTIIPLSQLKKLTIIP